MPRIECNCGNPLCYGDIPNPIEWLLIADTAYDQFNGSVDAEKLYSMFTHMLVCSSCERLWVFWNGFNAPPTEYIRGSTDENLS
jgi:hypothetical protein